MGRLLSGQRERMIERIVEVLKPYDPEEERSFILRVIEEGTVIYEKGSQG